MSFIIAQERRATKEFARGYAYLWTFINDTDTARTRIMKDESIYKIAATLHGATFIQPRRLISAVSLRGQHKWIDVESGRFYGSIPHFV